MGDIKDTNDGSEKVTLKRQVGLVSCVALIIGTIIGSGIFISPVYVLQQTQSVGMSLVIWFLGGVLAMIAFLFSWTCALILMPASVSAIALSFGYYMADPLYPNHDCEDSSRATYEAASKIFACLCILILTFINCVSVKAATIVQNVLTLAKLLALAIIIFIGFIRIFQGHTKYLQPKLSFEGSAPNLFAYGIAFYQSLWAYDGWNQLNFVTEEIKNPYRNLPYGILIGIPLVTVVYLLTNIAYFTVLSPEEMLMSSAVAVTFAERTLGPMAWIMPFLVCCSTVGAVNGCLFTAGRLPFVTAREGHMMDILAMVHVRYYTPLPSIVLTGGIAILMLLPSDFSALVNYFSFAAWLFYGLTILALILLRVQQPNAKRPIKIPIFIPIIGLVASIYLVLAPIINEPTLEIFYALLFILSGLLFYFPFVHFGLRIPYIMRPAQTFLQKLMFVAPSGYSASVERIEDKD
ncbi:putative b(0,+)-type amino acid transporter 1 isoform X1 [Apostichopus japonicus]|uniref:Putative b(0,+)-type amino acid transporter 1 isoform X1 n=1 Tax=Stichopus japonicus TaxID=307972 RepID=A0A2G8KVF7_STIJA|nr:putative b(0,+)-type amino acid transporter 1 isoform X1 [Apostichopus japonicus]